jgi:FkbH-like protein
VASLLRAVFGRSRKVAVLDLDNTLWGGQVGDVGPGGIHLGQGSGEGESYLAFQRYLKELQRRGILLAVCSKNSEEMARGPFEQREDMVLKLGDFACFVANYESKADNLRTIADRLCLKLDSFVFIDDNPAERAVVRRCLPEVAVPDMPADPASYIDAVARHRFFETTSLTREDSARARYYSAESQRRDLASKATDADGFLKSLDMRMAVGPIDELNLERATQLLNKSNQFNLTTRRYTVAQVREMTKSPEWRTLTFRLADNLGDNGLISVVLLRRDEDALVIDTWVMSCRVLLRGVEQFARNELATLARKEGCNRILGTYIPTPKNAMVKDHYLKMQFAPAGSDGETTHWVLDLCGDVEPLPHHIQHESVLCEVNCG